jgi:hypothetical protein
MAQTPAQLSADLTSALIPGQRPPHHPAEGAQAKSAPRIKTLRRMPTVRRPDCRRFELHRHVDDSGVSGTGIVAQGVQFTEGTVVLLWLGELSSVVVHAGGITNVEAIHGHAGNTEIVWLDPLPEGMR